MNKVITATEARKNFFRLVEQAGRPGFSVTITREGSPNVIVMSVEEFEGWQETLEILSDAELMNDIQESLKESGATIPLEKLLVKEQSSKNVQSRSQTKGKKTIRRFAKRGPAKSPFGT